MERDKTKENDKEPGSGERFGMRPNGRDKTTLVINRNGARKDLFSGKPTKENLPSGIRPTKASLARAQSMSASPDQKVTSKASLSRSQAAKTSSPKPLSLKEAYHMVPDEDEVGPGSPSPAPRPWRKTGAVAAKSLKSPTPGQGRTNGPVGTRRPGHALRHSVDSQGHGSSTSPASPDSHGAGSRQGDKSDSDFEERMKQFGISQQSNGGTQEEGKCNNGPEDVLSSPVKYRPWGVKAASATNGWLKHAMSSPTKADLDDHSGFDLDEDFTADNIQVSNSPPFKFGLGIAAVRQNTKLDEIRALEHAADLQYMNEPPEPLAAGSPEKNGNQHNAALPLGRTNTKIDEIRAREEEASSRRAIAKAKLDEIREHNAEARRPSLSPRKVRDDPPKLEESPMPRKPFSTTIRDEVGERIPATPITVYREVDIADSVRPAEKAGTGILGANDTLQDNQRKPLLREESLDAIRRLARATSSSPAPEPAPQVIQSDSKGGPQSAAVAPEKAKDTAKETEKPREETPERDVSPRFSRRDRNDERSSDLPRKSVGFAGVPRDPSTASEKSTRSARSDIDPTDRIERELQLFAPGENHSEMGSRAPTPYSDGDDVEETPRPTRFDPLTQPTPKVTGAYVETPATVKVERIAVTAEPVIIESQPNDKMETLGVDQVIRRRRPEISSRNPTHTSSAEGIREHIQRKERLGTGPGTHRRARSLTRSRSPLINSLQPPSVKDDLREIRRFHQIEDSTVDITLDNFGGVLADQDTKPSRSTRELTSKQQGDAERPEDEHMDTKELLAHQKQKVDRALEDTRMAKKGMDRLLDTVETGQRMKPDEKPPKTKPDTMPEAAAEKPPSTKFKKKESAPTPTPHVQPSPDTSNIEWVRLPMPILYRRTPKFKLTWLGVLFCLLSFYPIWYAAESTMCHFYCKPQYCYPGQPCVWSYDDPFWGYALPVKLDQWTTGGLGRSFVRKVRPEVEDWIADVWDAATGTDIEHVDTRWLSYNQRKRHRRRLMKKGLIKPPVETEEDKKVYAAWAAARKARERVAAMREMGFDLQEEESMTADEKVR